MMGREMIKGLLAVALSTVAFSALASAPLPRDVRQFLERREGCEHFRGEVPEQPGNERRMRQVEREIRKLCKGTDKELAQLKRKYASDPKVMRTLADFEPQIEAVRSEQRGE